MIPADKPHVEVAALSHPGERREINEDNYSVTAYHLDDSKVPALVAIVADGIGGHQAGEVASDLTVDTIVERVAVSDGSDPLAAMRAGIVEASQAVHQAANQDEGRQGMGSTVAAASLIGDRLYVAYVGDSRIYLQRSGVIRQISVDHTWVQEAIEHDVITAEEAVDHPHSHVLRRHVGGEEPPDPDTRIKLNSEDTDEEARAHQGLQLESGDTVLLCSDGLTDLVKDKEIESIINGQNLGDASQRLVELARRRGGHDNITVVLLKMPTPAPVRQTSGCLRSAVLLAIAALMLVLAGLIGLAWSRGWWPFGPLRREGPNPVRSAHLVELRPITAAGNTDQLEIAAVSTPAPLTF